MTLALQRSLVGVDAVGGFGEEHSDAIRSGNYQFPFMQVDDLSAVDKIIKPFCDQTHQLFGKDGSPSFDAAGVWIQRAM
jgi:hypothetical protein